VVLVAPFMEERQDAHEVLRAWALALAETGVTVLRFDLYGTGDAAGAWEDATVEGWCNDIAAMSARLRTEAGVASVGLVGLRFGATLAAAAAVQSDAAWVGLVQPVLDGERYAMEVLRAHLAAEMMLHQKAGTTREVLLARLQAGETINLFGYGFTPTQYRGMAALDVGRLLGAFGGEVRVVEVARTETARVSKEIAELMTTLGARGTLVRAVEPQSLYAEGKVRLVTSPAVTACLRGWVAPREEQG